jgi:hypothetical protein
MARARSRAKANLTLWLTECYINIANFIVPKVNGLRFVLVVPLIAMLVIAGCVTPPIVGTQPGANASAEKKCHTVSEQQPYLEESCNDVSVTKPVCGTRALPYDMKNISILHLCVDDHNCVGNPLGDCQVCTRAMTRCGTIITNKDNKSSGTWVMGANFTVTGGGFIRDPVSKTLGPGESYEFDFQQMYTPGNPISSASCNVYLVSAPKVDDCHDETRVTKECQNVTKYKTVERQVCE